MNIRRIMIAAPKSGSGKTTVVCALLQAFQQRKEQVYAYKCGPDYIDPMFHEQVIGVPSYNLDTFFTGEEETKALFCQKRKEGDLAILEGVMGLYDGLGGIREEGSSYHLATVTQTPIVLVVDAKGMGKSLVAMLSGFLQYDREQLICGVILNKVSASYYPTLKAMVESELSIQVLGYLPEDKESTWQSRQLGLLLPNEIPQMQAWLAKKAAELEQTVSIEELLACANAAPPLEAKEVQDGTLWKQKERSQRRPLILAVAKDEAFCFYYKENLQLLEACGATIQYFSPLRDRELPKGCAGILLGGGYPELYAKQLEENVSMRTALREAFAHGMPFLAECGGFLYLHHTLRDPSGNDYEMVGILPGGCLQKKHLVRFGYVKLEACTDDFLPKGTRIKGHEFHYYDSEDNGTGFCACKPTTGKTYPCIVAGAHYAVGFPHVYYPSNPLFPKKFVEKMSIYDCQRNGL